MKATNQQITNFRNIGTLFLRFGPSDTKLNYAVQKMVKKLKNASDQFVDACDDLRDEKAAVDEKTKVIIRDSKGERSYTQENLKSLRKELRNLQNEEVEITTHFVKQEELPKTLEFDYDGDDGKKYTMSAYDVREAFLGIVIEDIQE